MRGEWGEGKNDAKSGLSREVCAGWREGGVVKLKNVQWDQGGIDIIYRKSCFVIFFPGCNVVRL